MSGRKPLPQPRRPDQHVRGHMKAIPNLAHHGHAELSFPGHDLADPTGRPQEFGEPSPREAVLVHQIGQKLRERGRPTGPTALLVRFDQSRLADEARLIRWISRIHQFFDQRFRLLVIPINARLRMRLLHILRRSPIGLLRNRAPGIKLRPRGFEALASLPGGKIGLHPSEGCTAARSSKPPR